MFRRILPLIISLSVLAITVYIRYQEFPIVEQIKYKVFDTYQQNKPRTYTDLPVRIIDIDDESLSRYGQWPWPRNLVAELIDKLAEAGAASIAFDIVFAEKDRTSPENILPIWQLRDESYASMISGLPRHDEVLAQSILRANVVTGFVLMPDATSQPEAPLVKAGMSFTGPMGAKPQKLLNDYGGAIQSLQLFQKAAKGNGSFNSNPDLDGIIRRIDIIMTMNGVLYPTLSAESLRVAQRARNYLIKMEGTDATSSDVTRITSIRVGDFNIPTDKQGKLWLYYTPSVEERYIPAWKILEGVYDASQLEGYILFLGTSAQGLRDIRSTPLNSRASGVEVHVQAVEQIITGEHLKRPDIVEGLELIIMIVAGLILMAIISFASALWGAVFTLLLLAGALSCSWYMFAENQILIEPVYPAITIILLYFTMSLSRFIASEKERYQIRNAFSHYMSPVLVQQLAKNPQSLKLGGETKNLTCLFCDIRGFTSISEGMSAEELTQFINRFLTPMTDVILSHKGTIDKYMGDCIMAFWNAPLDDPEHPKNACNAALNMLQELKKLNAELEVEREIRIGIGINTGECSVGNMGSDQRFDYSVLGDSVNLASRLEGQCKPYGAAIIIGANTAQALGDTFCVVELDRIRVKGKDEAETIYALLDGNNLSSAYQDFKEDFLFFLKTYRARQWTKAARQLKQIQQREYAIEVLDITTLCQTYRDRITVFQKTPPAKNWDGVYIATSK